MKPQYCLIKLNGINDVLKFVKVTSNLPYQVDLGCGMYLVNAKSLMGILSLDLKKTLTVYAYTHDDIEEKFKKWRKKND